MPLASPAEGDTDDRLYIGVLGPLLLRQGHQGTPAVSERRRCLLGLLALHANQSVDAEEIIELMWDGRVPNGGRNLLHTHVCRLRGLLGADNRHAVERTSNGYRLVTAPSQLDLAAFDDLVARGRHATTAGRPDAALDLYTEALDCWRGSVLADVPALLQHPAAVAAEQRRLELVLTHADLAVELGRHEQATSRLRLAVQNEPLHEGLHARLMLALAAGGQQAAAMTVFETIRDRLDAELGLRPGPDLWAARAAILHPPAAVSMQSPTHPVGPQTASEPASVVRPVAAAPDKAPQHPGPLQAQAGHGEAHTSTSPVQMPSSIGSSTRFGIRRGSAAVQVTGLSVRTVNDLERSHAGRTRHDPVRLLAGAPHLEGGSRASLERAAARPGPRPLEVRGDPPVDRLPLDLADFTGRRRQVGELLDRLRDTRSTNAVVGVSGRAGVGKTALTVHVAHQLRDQFPGGRLFVSLTGMSGKPVAPEDVLSRILLLLGMDHATIPSDVEGRVELYGACLSARRVLVVLDDAADEAQVRLLLPPYTGSAVLITSRRSLVGLEAVRWLPLRELDEQESVELLGKVTGAERVAAQPDGAVAIVRLCSRLPLAIRIAGAKLAVKPHWTLWELADRLASEMRRLDELQAGDLAIRTSLSLSYRTLDDQSRRVLRTLGLLRTADFPPWVAAALLGLELTEVEAVLERLVDWHLLEPVGRDPVGRQRYRMHDLLALFARECAQDESPRGEPAGLSRVLQHGLTVLDSMEARLTAGGKPPADTVNRLSAAYPLGWLPAQRAVVSSRTAEPVTTFWELGWTITGTLVATSFELWSHWDDWLMTREAALIAAQRPGDRLSLTVDGEPAVLHGRTDPWGAVVADLEACSTILNELDDHRWRSMMLAGLGNIYRAQGRLDAARHTLGESLRLFRDIGHLGWQAAALFSMGSVLVALEQLPEAVECYAQVSDIFANKGDQLWLAYTRRALGFAYQQHGRYAEATVALDQCLPVFRDQCDWMSEAYTLLFLGYAERGQGRVDDSAAHLDAALRVFREHGDWRGGAMASRALAAAERERGSTDAALKSLQCGLAVFREMDDPVGVAFTTYDLASLHRSLDNQTQVRSLYRTCLSLFRDLGLSRWAARSVDALRTLDEPLTRAGDPR
ncbi:MAG TPA: BTAD domain-containing putative transcriptional regulator [Micromonosporaceae bacterium]|nr:BTAD domain-containing putative transcriptional regulator [Micromonosporaceae bacterium]